MRPSHLVVAALATFLPAQATPVPIPLAVTGLDAQAPLTLAATLDGLQLKVQVALQPSWHLYGKDTGNGQPVRIDIRPGSVFKAAGPLQVPMDGKGEVTGKAELILPLHRTTAGNSLLAQCSFMVCDPLQCLPPMTVELATPPTVLLVVVERGARADRIAAFLTERGCRPTLITYKEVQVAECDASDLVVADSPTFGKLKGQTGVSRQFPLTSAPVIAIGLLGTELLKAQKVSMASGYV